MKRTRTIILALSAALCLSISGCGGYKTMTADPSEVKAKQAAEDKNAVAEAQADDSVSAEDKSTPSTAAEPAE